MPGPPPPPPPVGLPPPPMPSGPLKMGSPDDRGALLKSIQKGTKLKKTVTNDKSAPLIGGKVSGSQNASSNNQGTLSSSSSSSAPQATNGGLNLGGLFAGGMPKLRPTGKLGGPSTNSSGNNSSNSSNSNSSSTHSKFNNSDANHHNQTKSNPPPIKSSLSNVQNELKKQMASDNRNRGPPPPAPFRSSPSGENGPSAPRQPTFANATTTKSNSNGLRANQSSLHSTTTSNVQTTNSSMLHRKAASNFSLPALDTSPDSPTGDSTNHQQPLPPKPVINHGKPNLAPKPPSLNGKPTAPPKKLIINGAGKPVSRAHSMRSPRSPTSPQTAHDHHHATTPMKFGTVRNLSSVIGQSLAQSTGSLNNSSPRQRPMLNGRPNAPPPGIPSQAPPPPPPSKTGGGVKPPSHAPPPPPVALPQAPSHTPPPPPHRTFASRAPPVPPPSTNNGSQSAPPPPPRHSSMTTSNRKAMANVMMEFEDKFKFQAPSTFPKPPPYRNVYKFYGSKQAGYKQQAPQPPQPHLQSWEGGASPAC